MAKERFSDVIERASADTSLVSVAARWGTNEQNLRRWRDNPHQSPKFDQLQSIARRMTPAERMDTARVLFGVKLIEDLRPEAQVIAHKALETAKAALAPLVMAAE